MQSSHGLRVFRLTCVSVLAVSVVLVSLAYMADVREARSQQPFEAQPFEAQPFEAQPFEAQGPARDGLAVRAPADGGVLPAAGAMPDDRGLDLAYQFASDPGAGRDSFAALNRAQNLRIAVARESVQLAPATAAGGDWVLGLQLKGYGRSSPLGELTVGDVVATGEWAERSYGALTESYRNRSAGLEQGFDLQTAPEQGSRGQAVVLEFAFESAAVPRVAPDGAAVGFFDGSGVPVVRWEELRVTDSTEKLLDASFQLATSGLRMRVWDGGATYPLRIEARLRSLVWFGENGQLDSRYGASVALADVNGDGLEDRIVGADRYDTGIAGGDEGAVFVDYGSPTGEATLADWTALGDQGGARFGASVASAGDVNGDGYDDIIVGAAGYDGVAPESGKVFVFYGSELGLSAGEPFVLSSAAEWSVEGRRANVGLGGAVAGAGDVNGDGYADVLLGASQGAGAAYVFHGAEEGLADGTRTSSLDDAAWSLESIEEGAELGAAVASAGDVNGDGYFDVVVGAPGSTSQAGAAYVFHGSELGLARGAREVSQRQASWSIAGAQRDARLGAAVASAGDVDGDGYDDVLLGAPLYDSLLDGIVLENDGAAYVCRGSENGFSGGALTISSDTADWTVAGGAERRPTGLRGDRRGGP